MKLTFQKNWGILFDAIKLMALKIRGKKNWPVHQDTKEDDIEYFEKRVSVVKDLPEDIEIFFYVPQKEKGSYIMFMFDRLLSQNPDEHILTRFLEYFKNAEKVKAEVLDFYYSNMIKGKCDIGAIIKSDRRLPGKLKFELLDFSMNANARVAKLKKNLGKYYKIAEKIHAEEAAAIEEGRAAVSEEAIDRVMQTYSLKPLNGESMTYSITAIMKDMVAVDRKNCWLIVGKSFLTHLGENTVREETNLEIFKRSDILGDEQRYLILETLLKNQEKGMTISDLAEELNTVVSSLQHHLRKMVETGFVMSEKKGKKRFYYVNLQVFVKLGEILSVIGREGKLP